MSNKSDIGFMRHALSLARRNLGQTWPNPAVGAVAVKNNHVIGTGWTARGGRPHAEPQALAQAGAEASGATLYVTLEPCAHTGQTPPCTEAIIEAGIARVAVACRDANPRVNGQGIASLRAAGVEVEENICRAEAEQVNEGFFSVVTRGRPFVSLKIATSRDDKIAYPPPASPPSPPQAGGLKTEVTPLAGGFRGEAHPACGGDGGETRWITGEAARDYGHLLRAGHDAILTGIGTVLADDPRLTCRLPGMADRSPVRVVLDRKGRLPAAARAHPCWVYSSGELAEILAHLASRGITRLLVEGGAALTCAFLSQGLADRIYWFRAPLVIGEKGLALDAPLANYRRAGQRLIGADQLEIYEPCSPA